MSAISDVRFVESKSRQGLRRCGWPRTLADGPNDDGEPAPGQSV